jgi:hypothetical protein
MVPENTDIIGIEQPVKMVGISEFTFTVNEEITIDTFLDKVTIKKKEEPKIIVKNGRNKHKKRGDNPALF